MTGSFALLPFRSLPPAARANGVTAVLGPTNTGKTHLAIERMVAHPTGMIGLPLRLLAREVYQRVVDKVGPQAVALVTGEEKIKPERPRFWVCTVEAMPRDLAVDFVAIDEIQLAADLDRGHVFTDRLLNRRGRAETMLIGAGTMRPLVEQLMPGVNVVTRPRLSSLAFAGDRKITRLPPRSAIVAFSVEEVYAIAELIRRQKGGAAVVLGALSPRTRNAQVEIYQSGDVDYLVATDAIGMGLNLDVDHIAFAGDRKFDGHHFRRLHPAEFGQIAGRAGRHLRDGSFGTSGRCPPFDAELVEAIENHRFEPVRQMQWRNSDLDLRSVAGLLDTLNLQPSEQGLTRALIAEDMTTLEALARDADVAALAQGRAAVERLWEVCGLPDYRKISPMQHADLATTLYLRLMRHGRLDVDWYARQLAGLDRTDGEIDTLSARIAQVRTWTFVANRPDWLPDPEHWQGMARLVEDKLSDALHERLAHRFVDRRTSVLMRRLRENAMLEAEVTATGDVLVEGQHVGMLQGFRFTADPKAGGPEVKALNLAAMKALGSEIEARAARVVLAGDDAFVLAHDGLLRWTGEPVARLTAGEKALEPRLRLLVEEHLSGPAREQVEARLALWLKNHITRLLGAIQILEAAESATGIARGIAFQAAEALGVLERAKVGEEMKALDQEGRAALRQLGLRFGAFHIYMPALLKPAPRALAAQLWALKHGGPETAGLDDIAHLAASGRTSFPVDKAVPKGLYRAAGYRVCGERAVRVDILERLADLIRPAIAYRPGLTQGTPPAGAADQDGFVATGAMTSLVGCAGEDFASILRSLGYVSLKRPGPAITVPLAPSPAATEPAQPVAAAAEADVAAAPEAGTEAAQPESDALEAAAEAEGPSEPATALNEEAPAGDETPVAEAPAVETADTPVLTEAELDAVREPVPADALAALPVAAAEEAAPAEAPAVETAPAEPELIEVWRPHRHQGGRRPEHGQRGRRDGDERRGDRPQRDGRPAGQRRDQRPGQPRPAVARAEGEAAQGQRQERPRQERPHQERPRRDDQPQRQGRPEGNRGPRPDFKRDGRPGGPRREERGGAERFQQAPRPRPANREPDPDSPFAKLAALKAQLEGKT
ncbi:helicase-related protein [Bosea sp. (in: a-proteobacteria)]|uniref:helicase-related protein n=1 Tax=Bosea sp. (in: a-proteobacteria) TaxID=1871050 RepID=UPI002626A9BA|nr:helicase-related protein [Bosea sp. (in: a-proteobacteria)]MCO5089432.1 helicase [Bosea sp. (in: a-proteobacteria)]